jgi:hypothetical protein
MCGCVSLHFPSPLLFIILRFWKGNEIRAHVCAHNLVSSLKSLRVNAGHDALADIAPLIVGELLTTIN